MVAAFGDAFFVADFLAIVGALWWFFVGNADAVFASGVVGASGDV